jgi:hypothetical protein
MARDMPDSGILYAVAGVLENNKHMKKLVLNNLNRMIFVFSSFRIYF